MNIGLVTRNNKLLITDQLFTVYSLLNPSTIFFLQTRRTNLQNQSSDLVLENKTFGWCKSFDLRNPDESFSWSQIHAYAFAV